MKAWNKKFYAESNNVVAQNVCTRIDPFDACLSRRSLETIQHVFNYKIETEGKPMTDQKISGRCWIFAALNCIRVPFIKENKLEEFEFSQGHLFYWDKLERCHYFLHNIVETSKRGEKPDGRLFSFLLSDPTIDGGQWDMFCNLVCKYGLMPKKCFPESFSCENSRHLNDILKSLLRLNAKQLHEAIVQDNVNDSTLYDIISKQMKEIHNVVGKCLGIPPDTLFWEYYSEKAYKSHGPITPKEFYEKLVKPVFDIDNKVCLINDPRSSNEYGKLYTVDCLGNVVGGRAVLYNNQPIEILMNVVKEVILIELIILIKSI